MANILKKFFNDFNDITEYYNFLVNKTKNHEYVEITNEWLIDNYYLLVEHKNVILTNKKQLKKRRKIINDNYYFLKNIVTAKNYNINFKYLVEELRKYQKDTDKTFTYQELSSIFSILIFIYTDRLNSLCREEYKKLVNREEVSKVIRDHDVISFEHLIPENFDIANNPHYIFEVNNQLYKIGKDSNQLFKELNEYLKENNISLKDIINDEYQKKIDNNLLISNIFSDFKDFFEFTTEELYEKVSKTERLLLSDPAYKAMTIESKFAYRKKLVELAKKKKMDEFAFLESIFNPEEHVGFQLFKTKNNTAKVICYIMTLFLTTSVLTFFLSKYFIHPRIIGFLILFIPISQLIIQIMNECLTSLVPATVMPKLDYSKGIPKESKTMVVIPTIVSNTKKIKEMFDVLESFYLVNKSDNLYFTLLGDVKASDKKEEDYDEEISKYGVEYAKQLNEKYKKDLFYFMYRKRIWNGKEDSYLGYERKRGALLQFNKVLLGEYVDEAKYYNVNMLHGNKLNIKYVITLDTDTKLVLNSAQPVLNAKKTKVICCFNLF